MMMVMAVDPRLGNDLSRRQNCAKHNLVPKLLKDAEMPYVLQFQVQKQSNLRRGNTKYVRTLKRSSLRFDLLLVASLLVILLILIRNDDIVSLHVPMIPIRKYLAQCYN
jgi:hypothetical protein